FLALCTPAAAQETKPTALVSETQAEGSQTPVEDDAAKGDVDEVATEAPEPGAKADAPDQSPEELQEEQDNSANKLNSLQQLQQTFTLKRTVNGEVETEQRTVTYSRDDPVRRSEAGETTVERLTASFDSEVLTRIEAFEEAKLDFVLADKNRDGALSEDEFAALVATWRDNEKRIAKPTSPEGVKQRELDAFMDAIDPETAIAQADAAARRKFLFMAGAATLLKQKDYISEYLLDFDAMDANGDALLKREELVRFREAVRGETTEM
ncbi:MAG: hypothetical protein AAGJ87_13325, partial [Pseudomonadota bacterium]